MQVGIRARRALLGVHRTGSSLVCPLPAAWARTAWWAATLQVMLLVWQPLACALTLEEAMERAAYNTEAAELLLLQGDELEGARRAAVGGLVPSLSARGTATRNNEEIRIGERIFTQLWDFQATVSASLDVFRPQAIPVLREAGLRTHAQRVRARSERGTLRREAARLYLLVFTARENLAAAERNIELVLEALGETQVRYDAGYATAADVAQADLAVARARNAELEARLVLEDGAAELAWLVRLDSIDPTALRPPSLRTPAAEGGRVDALVALDLEADAAAWRRRQDVWSFLPALTLGANYFIGRESLRAPDGVYWQATLALEWVLFDFARYGRLDASRAAEAQAVVRVEQAERQRDWEVERADRQHVRAAQRERLAEQVLDVAHRNRTLVRARFELGEATALERTQADLEVFLAETDIHLARLEVELARVDLAWLRGAFDDPVPLENR